MPAFSITPVTGFPPTTPQEFPNFIQFQEDGTNLGNADADTLNFGSGLTATRGVGENSNVVTVTAAGGGGSSPVLVVSLTGASNGTFGGASFSDWSGTVRQTSTDASWNETDNRIELTQTGLYEVKIAGKLNPNPDSTANWPAGDTYYGADVGSPALTPDVTRHAISFTNSWQLDNINYVSFSDTFVANVADISTDFIIPRLYANCYDYSTDGVLFEALVSVTRIGDAFAP